jgi:hypothetical protein
VEEDRFEEEEVRGAGKGVFEANMAIVRRVNNSWGWCGEWQDVESDSVRKGLEFEEQSSDEALMDYMRS